MGGGNWPEREYKHSLHLYEYVGPHLHGGSGINTLVFRYGISDTVLTVPQGILLYHYEGQIRLSQMIASPYLSAWGKLITASPSQSS
jgi:hypothetical protein